MLIDRFVFSFYCEQKNANLCIKRVHKYKKLINDLMEQLTDCVLVLAC